MALIAYVCPKCGRVHSLEEFRESRFCYHCGKFLTRQNQRLLGESRILKEDNESEMKDNMDSRVRKLLEFGKSASVEELVPVLEEEAAKIIKDDPFAFALAGVLDRGTKAEIIWTIPYYIKKQLGDLDPHFFVNAAPEDLERIIDKLPVKPRYVNAAPRTIKGLSHIVVNECNGQAQKLWEKKSSRAVKATFERIYGVGPGIASMIVLLLERWLGVQFDDVDHRNMDVKPDTHIVRVFSRLGFISEPKSKSAVEAARRLNPDYPGALDSPTWIIGKKWCTAFVPHCQKCPLKEVCPKNY